VIGTRVTTSGRDVIYLVVFALVVASALGLVVGDIYGPFFNLLSGLVLVPSLASVLGRETAQSSPSTGSLRGLSVALTGVHFITAVHLAPFAMRTIGSRYGAGSWDQLAQVGTGGAALVSAWAPFLLSLLLVLIGQLVRRSHRVLWTVPAAGLLCSTALCVFFISRFQEIPPLTGG
jgi:hypothetical protein